MNEIRMNERYQNSIKVCAGLPIDWNLLAGKTILITGATGMIGTFMVDVLMHRNRYFRDNIRILAMSRDLLKAKERFEPYWEDERFYFIRKDVNEPVIEDSLHEALDYIIHGAGNTHPLLYANHPIDTIETNVTGTKNLLELTAKLKNCRLVFLSSVEIYGENRGDTEKFAENYCGYIDCNTLRACYTEGKRLGETLCQAYISERQVDAVIPRLCRVYGPTMHLSDSKAIAQLIKKAAACEDIILKSKGHQLYSYVYVADAVSAILTVMLKGKNGEAYNVADEESDICLKDMAEYLASVSGKEVIYEIPDENERKGYSTATKAVLNTDKLQSLGWKSIYHIQEGLKLTYDILHNTK